LVRVKNKRGFGPLKKKMGVGSGVRMPRKPNSEKEKGKEGNNSASGKRRSSKKKKAQPPSVDEGQRRKGRPCALLKGAGGEGPWS